MNVNPHYSMQLAKPPIMTAIKAFAKIETSGQTE
jgi:hypothetical protein